MSKDKEDSKTQKESASLSSKSLMGIFSSSDEEEDVDVRRTESNRSESASEDGEIDENMGADTPQPVVETTTPERMKVDALVEAELAAGGRDVMQKDARYYMLDQVVCGHCGVKGHLSYDCTEEEASIRCFICAKSGHSSKDCPDDCCYYCNKTGHKQKDCPDRASGRGARKRRSTVRIVRPPRPPKLKCYVCGLPGHLDCSLGKGPKAVLSCYNCGMTGHAGGGCNMTSVDKVIPIVMEMERERKQLKTAAREGKKKGDKGDKEEDTLEKRKDSEVDISKLTPKEYRQAFLDRAKKSRYSRG